MLNRALAPIEHPGKIHAQLLLPLLSARIEKRSAGIRGGIVHQDVEPAITGGRLRDQGIDILPASHIGLLEKSLATRFKDDIHRRIASLDRPRLDIRNDDARTFARKAYCDRSPDP